MAISRSVLLLLLLLLLLLHSNFGPCIAMRGCYFPDGKTIEIMRGSLLHLARRALWWTCWRGFFPDVPVQCPEYAFPEVVAKLGGRTRLGEVSHRYFHHSSFNSDEHILTLVHGVCRLLFLNKSALSLAVSAAQCSTFAQDKRAPGLPPLISIGDRFPFLSERRDYHHAGVLPCKHGS